MAPNIGELSDGQQGGLVGAAAAGSEAAFGGLSRASSAAGDVLRGIFGGLPWEMAADAITDAVASGGGDAAMVIMTVIG